MLYRVTCAQYGGPIAVVRDDRKVVIVRGGITKPVIRTFTASGSELGSFLWEGGRIVAMTWTLDEDLAILVDSGEVSPQRPPTPRAHKTKAYLRNSSAKSDPPPSTQNTS